MHNSGLGELLEVVNVCGLAEPVDGRRVTDPADPYGGFLYWREALFVPVLLPHLSTAVHLSQTGALRELIELDQTLDLWLEEPERNASKLRGRSLLQAKTPRGERLLARVNQKVRSGHMPGHFPTLFAVRASAFAFPSRTIILAYVLEELTARFPDGQARMNVLFETVEIVNERLRCDYTRFNPDSSKAEADG